MIFVHDTHADIASFEGISHVSSSVLDRGFYHLVFIFLLPSELFFNFLSIGLAMTTHNCKIKVTSNEDQTCPRKGSAWLRPCRAFFFAISLNDHIAPYRPCRPGGSLIVCAATTEAA